MGDRLSKPKMDYSSDESQSESQSQTHSSNQFDLTNEIFHLTKLRSDPTAQIRTAVGSRAGQISTVRMLSGREISSRGFSQADRSCVLNRCLPIHGPRQIDRQSTRAYVSQFSHDGSLLVSAFQGSHIRIYDVEKDWKVDKDILARSMRWTITDTALSPDRRFLVYASMSPVVNIVNIGTAARESYANITDIHEGLDFSAHEDVVYAFGIFSVKFSSDGREILAGTNDDSIYIYDLQANKVSLRLPAHSSDVNTVAFADESSHLIFSGGDDCLCKVWDRRCIGQVAGVLNGHLDGITCIDSRADGRYFISNGKDQTIKLWDIRKMTSDINRTKTRYMSWDYRYTPFPEKYKNLRHPNDQSIATYTGHSVLRTLMRCYFSPQFSTGQRYIYTGSHDSSVYIYDVVTGERVAKLDCHKSQIAVRDASWHPYYPLLVNCSWDGLIASWQFEGNSHDGDEMEFRSFE